MKVLAGRIELARELGISPSTFARYRRLGLIPSPLKGTQRYVREDVLAAMRAKTEAPALQPKPVTALEDWKRRHGY